MLLIYSCMTTNWSVMDLLKAPPLKKKDSISPSNYQLTAAPHLGVGFSATSLLPCWIFVRLGLAHVLCLLSHCLWVHMCMFPALSGKHCFLVTNHIWLLKIFFPSILKWTVWNGMRNGRWDIDAPFRAVWSLLFSAPWPVVGPWNFF